MFNMSGSEIIVILLLALVVLGPEKLPDAVRRAGRTYSELKKMGNSFQSEMRSVLDEPMKEMRDTADLLKKSVDFTDGEATGSTVAPARPASPARPAGRPAPAVAPTPDDAPPASEPDHPVAAAPTTADDELIDRTLSGDQ